MGKLDKEKEKPDQKQLDQSKDASIDFPVEVIATEADPYHETGAKFHAGKKKADELVKRGWVKLASLLLFMFAAAFASAQTSVIAPLYNATNTYTLAHLQAATATVDTVTNTGTGALYSKRIAGPGTVTIQVNVLKVSGTVAGTATLLASVDGVNYDTLRTPETRTIVPKATLRNTTGTGVYTWRLVDSPYLYYAVSFAGGTTTVYRPSGYILKH